MSRTGNKTSADRRRSADHHFKNHCSRVVNIYYVTKTSDLDDIEGSQTSFLLVSLSRMQHRVVTCLIALVILLSQSAGELVGPQSTESLVGDTTYFNCSTDITSKEIFWYHGKNYIYVGENGLIVDPYRGRFDIDRNASNGSHNLVIHSVELGDEGEYTCVDDDGHGTKRSAELVVFEKIPDCNSNIHDGGVIGENVFNIPLDEVQFTCNVSYHGNIPPQMEWKKIGENKPIEGNVAWNIVSNNRLIYTLKLKGDTSLDTSSYVCQTKRSTQNQYQCTSEIIKVLYFIGGNKSEQNVYRGDTITCLDQNTTFNCTRYWYHDTNTCPLSCAETITTHLLGTYKCTVKCNIRGTDFSYEVLKTNVVEAATSPSLRSGTIAAIVLIIIIIITILVVLIASYVVRKNTRKHEQIIEDAKNNIDMVELGQKFALKSRADSIRNRTKRVRSPEKLAEEEIQLLHKIKYEAAINENEKMIRGVAILGDNIFIARENSSNLEVFDHKNLLPDGESINVLDLVDAIDICSHEKSKCLYIMDKKVDLTPKEVIKISTVDNSQTKWSTEDNAGGYLSVTEDEKVVVAVQLKHMLLEYSSDKTPVRHIKLPKGINPWHAIKVENDRYVVSHGTIFDTVHGVCMVNKDGTVEKSFGHSRGSADNQLDAPYYLARASSGYLMVADLNNDRVLVLDPNLKFKTKLIAKHKQKFRRPRRVYLDEKQGHLGVVIVAGDPKKIERAERGTTSTENKGLLTNSCTNERVVGDVDASQQIEEDCRLLVFDIQLFMQKCKA